MSVISDTEAWHVQQIIDNLRVPHRISPDMTYLEALEEFSKFSSVSRDALVSLEVKAPDYGAVDRRPNITLGIDNRSVLIVPPDKNLLVKAVGGIVFTPPPSPKITFN